MRKLIITESEKKSILTLHGIVEQTTTVVSGDTSTGTTTTTKKVRKPMYGTPEQRAAAQAKRAANRKKMNDLFVMGAIKSGFYEEVDDNDYNMGVQSQNNTPDELGDFYYQGMEDTGVKLKVNLKKYRKYVEKMGKKPDVPLDGLNDVKFTHTNCGISKSHAKQDKKDWNNKSKTSSGVRK